MLGRGYTSGSVTKLSLPKSPHGLHVPSFLGTICRGEAQGEVNLCTIPSLSITSNSCRVASSLAPSSLLNLEAMGGPDVLIWCRTSWLGTGRVFPTFTTSGKLLRTSGTVERPAVEAEVGAAAPEGAPRDPEGTFTRGTPETATCPPQEAEEAGVKSRGGRNPVNRGQGSRSPL
jgi:hypothetical protein